MSKNSTIFTSTPQSSISRNLFDLAHEVKMSGKFGFLYPVLNIDVLPGDTVRDQMTAFLRFAPLLSPVLHRFDVTTHFFFVPYRIICDSWQDFITGGQDGTLAPVLPFVTPQGLYTAHANDTEWMRVGTLWDYLGLPTIDPAVAGPLNTEHISVFAFYAYAKIWNDWYRDPNLDTELDIPTDVDGDVSAIVTDIFRKLQRRGFEKDYFTSSLPWAQRGAEVLMPLAGTASVTYKTPVEVTGGTQPGAMAVTGLGVVQSGGTNLTTLQNIESIDIDGATTSINDLYRSIAIQKWMQRNAVGGGRYVEQIESHFKTRVPDFRLQRAEYLGGGKQPVTVFEVLATAESAEVNVGDMKGHGVSVGKSNRFTYRCQEHGVVIGILSVMPRTAYSQGIERMWTRATKFDYAWPELAHIGEQETLSKEVFYDFAAAGAAANQNIFGYIPRYAEYKFKNDRIAGDFKTTLGYWHDARFFTVRPVLDPVFTTMYEDGDDTEESFRRIFAVQDGTDYLWMQLFHKLTIKRSLPYFGVPSI